MTECRTCGELKPQEDFYRNRTYKSGFQKVCKSCSLAKAAWYRAANRDALIQRSRQYRLSHPEAAKSSKVKSMYGLGPKDIEAMKRLQGGRCFICQNSLPDNFHVDHDHNHCDRCSVRNRSCREGVRELTCPRCNTALLDDPRIAERSAYYLKVSPKGTPTGTGWC